MRWVVVVAVSAVALCGCSREGPREDPTTGPTEAVAAPSWRPLSSGDVPGADPSALVGLPSVAAVEQAAEAGPTRLAGEQFALAALHLVLDVRPGIRGEEVVSSFASPALDARTRAYLVNDIDVQQAAGTERQIDATLSTWVRSRVLGAGTASPRVEVEVFYNLRSEPMNFNDWTASRLDVLREDDGWRVVAYSDGSPGVTSDAELTPAERRHLLTGTGWRRIPPG